MDRATLDQARGLMVGTAVGDCLGRPIEGRREVSPIYIESLLSQSPLMTYSDDTAMTIAVAESLLACQGFDGADMSRRFAEEFRAEPWRGYGGAVQKLFDRVLRGVDWQDAARRQFGGSGSYGNGAAMRVAPVALWGRGDYRATLELARQTASVTHTHPSGVDGAVLIAIATLHAIDGQKVDETLEDLTEVVRSDEFKAKMAVLPRALERRDDEYARDHLGHWVAAHDSVVTAVYCHLASASFEEAVLRALRMGGDTDTIAAMAGALSGARYGFDAIPPAWREPEGVGLLIDLAERLTTD